MSPSTDERTIADEAASRVVHALATKAERGAALVEVIGTTLFHERQRLAHANGSERDVADRSFYADIAGQLNHRVDDAAVQTTVAAKLVEHYAREIEGHFDPRVYAFATRALPVLLTGLLHGIAPRRVMRRLGQLSNIDDHVHILGDVARLSHLARLGTILLVPTHSSNLDSLITGYAIYRMGLPPFAYGAGLNLFSNPIEGFFMRHLGAYTVDRQKSDPLYRDLLKEYAAASLEHGRHNVFFPGGTRSRSGAIESHLKKGLLGTALTAFRRTLQAGKKARFYVVPCTLSYPLVLEAATLIDDHLRESGKARHIIVDDEYSRTQRWVDFLSGMMDLDVRIHVTIGAPLDPFGNDVDGDGESRDPRGRAIDPARYLLEDGRITEDAARDAAYTTTLAARILGAYRRDNVVLPTAILAFTAFELLRARAHHTELHRFLRDLDGASIPIAELVSAVEKLLDEVGALAARGGIRVCDEVRDRDVTAIIDDAIRTLGTYHTRAVVTQDESSLRVGDPNLLLYYRNRLDGYGFLGAPALAGGGAP